MYLVALAFTGSICSRCRSHHVAGHSWFYHTILQCVVKCFLSAQLAHPVLHPVVAIGGCFTGPCQQAVLERACFEQRSDRRLYQAVVTSLWFSISPAFQEVMIRHYIFTFLSSFVHAVGKRNRYGHLSHTCLKLLAVRVFINGVKPVDEQR